MIERNRARYGRLNNMAFGLAQLVDGIVRVLSLGHLHTRLPLEHSKRSAKRQLERLKREAHGTR